MTTVTTVQDTVQDTTMQDTIIIAKVIKLASFLSYFKDLGMISDSGLYGNSDRISYKDGKKHHICVLISNYEIRYFYPNCNIIDNTNQHFRSFYDRNNVEYKLDKMNKLFHWTSDGSSWSIVDIFDGPTDD